MDNFLYKLVCPEGFRLDAFDADETAEHLRVSVICERRKSLCPKCAVPSRQVHSRYQRTAADVPLANWRLTLQLTVRKFVCREKTCSRRIFTERLPDVLAPWARRTARLVQRQTAVGLACGGIIGSRLIQRWCAPASRQTLRRLVRSSPLPAIEPLRVVGIDDWAICRRVSYGTIVVDLERRRPVALLAGRESQTIAAWLQQHPGIEVLSRDRANAYSEGATVGAPQAVQVADRFHLLRNLSDALQRVFNAHASRIGTVQQKSPPSTAMVTVPPPIVEMNKDHDGIDSPQELPTSASRAYRLERYERVWEKHRLGWSQRAIAKALQLDPKTIRHYLNCPTFPERKPRRSTASVLEPYKTYLLERWQAGCRNAMRLFADIKDRGFRGQRSIVAEFVTQLRHSSITPPPGSTESGQPLTPSSATWLVLDRPERQDDDDRQLIEQLKHQHTDLATAITLSQTFAQLIRERQHRRLNDWLRETLGCGIGALQRFAAGIERDYAAVHAAMSLEWSNGPVEGHINRLKMLKREMFGRAKIDLLARRFLLPI